MNDLDFCKQQITAIAEQTGTNLKGKVAEFLEKRMPIEAAYRSALRAWATGKLATIESMPGGGVSRLVPRDELAEASRQMVLQTVISEIDAFEREPG